jgi:hypothetical protein
VPSAHAILSLWLAAAIAFLLAGLLRVEDAAAQSESEGEPEAGSKQFSS